MSQHDTKDGEKPQLRTGNIDLDFVSFYDEISKKKIRLFCEEVNKLACENMLKPPYKLEGQHKRAMVLLCKQLNVPLTFEDDV